MQLDPILFSAQSSWVCAAVCFQEDDQKINVLTNNGDQYLNLLHNHLASSNSNSLDGGRRHIQLGGTIVHFASSCYGEYKGLL